MKPKVENDVLELGKGADVKKRVKEANKKGWRVVTAYSMYNTHFVHLERAKASRVTNGERQ
jgi:hypothetical protein